MLSLAHLSPSLFLFFVLVSAGPTCQKVYVCVCVCALYFRSFSETNFLGFQLPNALISGSGSGIPLIQDIELRNSRDWLSYATPRFFSLAEQCYTQNFYLRYFKSDFDAVISEFGLLIE